MQSSGTLQATYLTDFCRIIEERDHPLPVAPPRLHDSRIISPPFNIKFSKGPSKNSRKSVESAYKSVSAMRLATAKPSASSLWVRSLAVILTGCRGMSLSICHWRRWVPRSESILNNYCAKLVLILACSLLNVSIICWGGSLQARSTFLRNTI